MRREEESLIAQAKAKREAGGAGGPYGLEYMDANMQEKREIVEADDFVFNWDALQRDYELLGDWGGAGTIKPKDSKDPTWKVPKERGIQVLIALATKVGRKDKEGRPIESTRGVRRWLLDNRPVE